MTLQRRLRGLPFWLGVAAVAVLLLAPIFYLASVSLKSPDDVLSGAFLPATLHWQNWAGALSVAPLGTFITNSLIASLLSGAVTLAVTLPAAHAIYRLGIARNWLPQLILGSFLAPPSLPCCRYSISSSSRGSSTRCGAWHSSMAS